MQTTTLTPLDDSNLPISLMIIFSDCGRSPMGNPCSHAATGKTCKVQNTFPILIVLLNQKCCHPGEQIHWKNAQETLVIKCIKQYNRHWWTRGRAERRFFGAVKEDIKLASAREEDAEERVRWRQMIG